MSKGKAENFKLNSIKAKGIAKLWTGRFEDIIPEPDKVDAKWKRDNWGSDFGRIYSTEIVTEDCVYIEAPKMISLKMVAVLSRMLGNTELCFECMDTSVYFSDVDTYLWVNGQMKSHTKDVFDFPANEYVTTAYKPVRRYNA